jgi:hypothetical protein
LVFDKSIVYHGLSDAEKGKPIELKAVEERIVRE